MTEEAINSLTILVLHYPLLMILPTILGNPRQHAKSCLRPEHCLKHVQRSREWRNEHYKKALVRVKWLVILFLFLDVSSFWASVNVSQTMALFTTGIPNIFMIYKAIVFYVLVT